jgi:hypothetical protein
MELHFVGTANAFAFYPYSKKAESAPTAAPAILLLRNASGRSASTTIGLREVLAR